MGATDAAGGPPSPANAGRDGGQSADASALWGTDPTPMSDAGATADGSDGGPAILSDAGTATDGNDGGPAMLSVTLPSRDIGPLTGAPDSIAADGAGVYWLTHDNELWLLDESAGAAGAVPRRVADDVGPSDVCEGAARLTVAGDQLFWVAEWSAHGDLGYGLNGHLHRTTKAGEDVVLVDVSYSDPIDVVVSGGDVYWNEGISADGAPPASTFVRTLPRDASPGTTPGQPVAVGGFEQVMSVAVIGTDLYWSTVYLGTTMPWPVLQRADLASLRQGMAPKPTTIAGAWMVRGHEGDLYFGQMTDLWHLAFTREPETLGPSTSLAVFTESAVIEIQFLDGWALTSLWDGGCGSIRYRLLAIPTDGSGGPIVQLAADLITPAVLGRELAFIDATGMLHLVSVDDVRAALGAALRSTRP